MSLVVAGSLAAGFVAAVALVATPMVPATESALTGAVLCGFALGWAALAGLSTRFTSQPQRWAAAPAVVLGGSGIALLALGSSAHPAIDWVWPPVLLGLALWMAARLRRDLAGSAARWLLYPVIAAMGLAAVGGAYQTIGAASDASTVSMPGRLVDVGGHRLHLSCTGSGSPTVVIEAGGGAMAANLGWITPAVARDTTICVYDRAGRGWSEDADAPQDAVGDLHRPAHPAPAGRGTGPLRHRGPLLRRPLRADLRGQAPRRGRRHGAHRLHRPPLRRGRSGAQPGGIRAYDVVGRVAALTSSLSRVGLGRLYATLTVADLPARERDELRASTATPGTLRSTIEEYARANDSMAQAASLRSFGDKPLMVLSAGVGSAADWPRKQERLAALSTDSVHRVVAGASHEALVADPVHAATTSQAILEVVESLRAGTPLSR